MRYALWRFRHNRAVMTQQTILVVDDEPDIREAVKDILVDEGYAVVLADNAEAARQARRARRPDAILLDIWMPDTDGISLLREWQARGGVGCPVLMMSGHGTIETAIEATRLGAWDFVEKPLSLAKLLLTLRRALEAGQLRAENEGLRRQLAPVSSAPVGNSRAMAALKAQLERAAPSNAPVLIRGEPGTGRETVARWLHAQGARRGGPFVRVAANALPRGRMGGALFGSEDQSGVSYGLVDQAQGGFLYLDGVAELDTETQRDLAAALETGAFRRNGGAAAVPLDLRVVAAVDGDPADAVRGGRLREDLYYQLNVLPLAVPALRERADDVPDLVDYFADYFASRDGLGWRRFTVAAQNRLRQHAWPGNLRELRNLVQRALILGGAGDVDVAEVEQLLGATVTAAPAPSGAVGTPFALDLSRPLREARDEFERAYLTGLLRQADGSVGRLAILSGMERTHLYRKLRDLGIDIRSVSKGD